eukprot:53398_1
MATLTATQKSGEQNTNASPNTEEDLMSIYNKLRKLKHEKKLVEDIHMHQTSDHRVSVMSYNVSAEALTVIRYSDCAAKLPNESYRATHGVGNAQRKYHDALSAQQKCNGNLMMELDDEVAKYRQKEQTARKHQTVRLRRHIRGRFRKTLGHLLRPNKADDT